ncbi:hypothetical protein ACFYXL_14320 [Streptomyces tsukubensis]|uniref:hypothetical protein n=1 Tax=Streptomyces tsukubensis TaxID=83656 RepID=UPI0036B8FEC7
MRGEKGDGPGQVPLFPAAGSGPTATGGLPEQLALLGDPVPVRIPAAEWSGWLRDPAVQARYWAKVHRTSSASECWFFFGAISGTGHGSFRAASLPGRTRRGTVPAHLYGYQLAHGVIPRLGWSGPDNPAVCHTCDNHSCQQPAHLRLGTAAENRAEWIARRRDPGGPLADLRGPAGRSRAIGTAVRAGRASGEAEEEIRRRIETAATAGRPLSLW